MSWKDVPLQNHPNSGHKWKVRDRAVVFRTKFCQVTVFQQSSAIAVSRIHGTMPVVSDMLMLFVTVCKSMSRFPHRSAAGMGSSSQDLADALLIIFQTNSSVAAKEVSGQAVRFS